LDEPNDGERMMTAAQVSEKWGIPIRTVAYWFNREKATGKPGSPTTAGTMPETRVRELVTAYRTKLSERLDRLLAADRQQQATGEGGPEGE
jgi:hypothetical protein